MDYRVGQTLKNRRRNADATFTILKLRTKHYADGNSALRVKGVLIVGIDAIGTHLREMDSRSLAKMFPYVLFDPPYLREETPQ